MATRKQSSKTEAGTRRAAVVSGTTKGSPSEQAGARTLADAHNIDEIFADGIAGMSLRAGIAKIDCYRVVAREPVEGGGSREVRHVSHRLVLPLVALNELHRVLQRSQGVLRKAQEDRLRDEAEEISSDLD